MNDLIEPHEPLQDCDCHSCALTERDKLKKDAARWLKIRRLTTIELRKSMTTEEKAVWDRLTRGGWYTADLEQLIDALDDMPNA